MLFEQYKNEIAFLHYPAIKSSMLYGLGILEKKGGFRDKVNFISEHYTLVYLISGNAEYTDQDGIRYSLSAGDFFQRFPGRPHSTFISQSGNYKEVYVMVGRRVYDLGRELEIIPEKPTGHLPLTEEWESQFIRLLEEFRNPDDYNQAKKILHCQKLLFDFFSASFQTDHADGTPIVSEACRILCSDFRKKTDLAEFCRLRHVNYHTFRRLFKAGKGISPNQFRQEARLARAREILRQHILNISEIAEELGYSSQFEFSRQFKRRYKISPARFRKNPSA